MIQYSYLLMQHLLILFTSKMIFRHCDSTFSPYFGIFLYVFIIVLPYVQIGCNCHDLHCYSGGGVRVLRLTNS